MRSTENARGGGAAAPPNSWRDTVAGLAARAPKLASKHLASKQPDFFSEKRPSARSAGLFATFFRTRAPHPNHGQKRNKLRWKHIVAGGAVRRNLAACVSQRDRGALSLLVRNARRPRSAARRILCNVTRNFDSKSGSCGLESWRRDKTICPAVPGTLYLSGGGSRREAGAHGAFSAGGLRAKTRRF